VNGNQACATTGSIGRWLATKQLDMSAEHTHTSFLSFTYATYKNKSAHNAHAKKSTCAYIRCTDLCCFSFQVHGGRRQKKFQSAAGQLDGIWYPLLGLKRQSMVCEMVLEPREAMYGIASISPDIAFH
jgi:hypothetical protein